jgi:NAD-dependent DNA ligase
MTRDADGQPFLAINYKANVEKAMDTLIGLCSGLIVDGKLTDREIAFLDIWLRGHENILHVWPASAIAERVRSILADWIITEAERADLLEALRKLVGGAWEDTGAASGMAIRLPVEKINALDFMDRAFCLTGKFVYGSRTKCEQAVLQRSGRIVKDVSRQVDYLVIGTLASRDWVHTTHGRKIERAVELQKEGFHIRILAEEDWAGYL